MFNKAWWCSKGLSRFIPNSYRYVALPTCIWVVLLFACRARAQSDVGTQEALFGLGCHIESKSERDDWIWWVSSKSIRKLRIVHGEDKYVSWQKDIQVLIFSWWSDAIIQPKVALFSWKTQVQVDQEILSNSSILIWSGWSWKLGSNEVQGEI